MGSSPNNPSLVSSQPTRPLMTTTPATLTICFGRWNLPTKPSAAADKECSSTCNL